MIDEDDEDAEALAECVAVLVEWTDPNRHGGADIINMAERRPWPGTEWLSYPGQCTACGYQAMHVAAIPDWAEAAPTPDCHKCGAERSVLPRRVPPETFNDGSAKPWVPPP